MAGDMIGRELGRWTYKWRTARTGREGVLGGGTHSRTSGRNRQQGMISLCNWRALIAANLILTGLAACDGETAKSPASPDEASWRPARGGGMYSEKAALAPGRGISIAERCWRGDAGFDCLEVTRPTAHGNAARLEISWYQVPRLRSSASEPVPKRRSPYNCKLYIGADNRVEEQILNGPERVEWNVVQLSGASDARDKVWLPQYVEDQLKYHGLPAALGHFWCLDVAEVLRAEGIGALSTTWITKDMLGA